MPPGMGREQGFVCFCVCLIIIGIEITYILIKNVGKFMTISKDVACVLSRHICIIHNMFNLGW